MSATQNHPGTPRCADCTLPMHGTDQHEGPDQKLYHGACFGRLFTTARHYQEGQGNLSFAHEEQRE